MASMFRRATRSKVRLRMALDGVSGSGKTFTALRFGITIQEAINILKNTPGKRVVVINSESGAVEKYLGLSPDGCPWDFDICDLPSYAPTSYTNAIMAAGKEGYDVAIIDSLSHAWAGVGGALEIKDQQTGPGINSFTAWKTVTPMHNRMIEAILHSPCHIIATMRSKTEYVLETNEKGKQEPRKVGMEAVQRQGMEYEFDIYGSIDNAHVLRVSKSRCPSPTVVDAVVVKPGADFITPVIDWMNDGIDLPPEHFAVTEEDLKRLEKASQEQSSAPQESEAEKAKKREQRKKELMEAAAKSNASAPVAAPLKAESPVAESAAISEPVKESDPQEKASVPEATLPADASVVQPATEEKSVTRNGKCSAEQAATIIELSRKLGVSPPVLRERIAEHTENKSENPLDLKIEVANEIIKKLQAAIATSSK